MLSVIIPVKNEEKNIPFLIKHLQEVLRITKYEIIFIDDYSTDKTLGLLLSYSQKNSSIKVISKKFQKEGIGTSIRMGIPHAKGNLIINMDGDLSHDPFDIPKLLKEMNKTTDLVIGSRYVEKGIYLMPDPRNVLSKLINFFLKNIFSVPIHDITSGYRIIKREKINKLNLQANHFDIHPEINLKAAFSRFHIKEVPITFNRRRFGKSKLRYWHMLSKYSQLIINLLRIKKKMPQT